jgi:hypothetical protein
VACFTILVGVDLPLAVRCILCFATAAAVIPTVGRCIWLRGPRALRAVEWAEGDGGEVRVYLRAGSAPLAGRLAAGTCRVGLQLIVLRLNTPDGIRVALIDGAVQGTAAFRRLCRLVGTRLPTVQRPPS